MHVFNDRCSLLCLTLSRLPLLPSRVLPQVDRFYETFVELVVKDKKQQQIDALRQDMDGLLDKQAQATAKLALHDTILKVKRQTLLVQNKVALMHDTILEVPTIDLKQWAHNRETPAYTWLSPDLAL